MEILRKIKNLRPIWALAEHLRQQRMVIQVKMKKKKREECGNQHNLINETNIVWWKKEYNNGNAGDDDDNDDNKSHGPDRTRKKSASTRMNELGKKEGRRRIK